MSSFPTRGIKGLKAAELAEVLSLCMNFGSSFKGRDHEGFRNNAFSALKIYLSQTRDILPTANRIIAG